MKVKVILGGHGVGKTYWCNKVSTKAINSIDELDRYIFRAYGYSYDFRETLHVHIASVDELGDCLQLLKLAKHNNSIFLLDCGFDTFDGQRYCFKELIEDINYRGYQIRRMTKLKLKILEKYKEE